MEGEARHRRDVRRHVALAEPESVRVFEEGIREEGTGNRVDVVEYILDGLEKALELERELGVRTVEIDRALLGTGVRREGAVGLETRDARRETRAGLKTEDARPAELVFLHDRPLSEKGVEMMAKILTALGKADAPIVVAPPAPQAKVTVVLGGLALKKYFPGMRGEPGQWQKTPDGRDVLITYSPEYILRFGTVTPAVQKIKEDMWRSLKAVKQRLSTS